jgi:hypothetical protein
MTVSPPAVRPRFVGVYTDPKAQFEVARRHAVNVLMLIYTIIVFDGVVRKYLFPDFQRELIFLRDPVVLYLYLYALLHSLYEKSTVLWVSAVLLIVCFVIILIQLFDLSVPAIIFVFGIRQYMSLIFLPPIMSTVLRRDDLHRFFRWNMIFLVLMAPVMVAQAVSPPDSWINAGLTSDEALVFDSGYYGDFVRAPGFFTSSQPVGQFLALLGAIIVFNWIVPPNRRSCSWPLLAAAMIALGVATAVGGNRAAIIQLLIVGGGSLIFPLIVPRANQISSRSVYIPVFVAVVFLLVSIIVFPEQFEALSDRWSEANQEAGWFQVVERAFAHMTEFLGALPATPVQGFGIGAGSNANFMLGHSNPEMPFAENDWSRHIVDLGPIGGILYIACRIALIIYLGIIAVERARRDGDPAPWLMFVALAPLIWYGTISGQSTMNALGWFGVGIVLASCKSDQSFQRL